jgi:hypothetical protein
LVAERRHPTGRDAERCRLARDDSLT